MGNFVPNPFRLAKDLAAAFFNQINGSAGWGDAAVLVPWALYWGYGDMQILDQQFNSMKAWVDYAAERIRHVPLKRLIHPRYWLDRRFRARQKLLWDTGYHWGEWLEPKAPPTAG